MSNLKILFKCELNWRETWVPTRGCAGTLRKGGFTQMQQAAARMVCHSTVYRARDSPSSRLSGLPSLGHSLYLGIQTHKHVGIQIACTLKNKKSCLLYKCVKEKETCMPSTDQCWHKERLTRLFQVCLKEGLCGPQMFFFEHILYRISWNLIFSDICCLIVII